MKARRSDSWKRLSRRRPTLRAARSPESLQRRIDASLTRRNLAASRVFSNLPVLYFTIGRGTKQYSFAQYNRVKRFARIRPQSPNPGPQLEWLREARSRGFLSRLPED